MPKVVYTAAKGLVQEAGSGMELDPSVGMTNNGFLAGFIPNAASGAAVTSGAVPVTNYVTFLSVTGTQAFTLADGTAVGQLKKLITTTAASTPQGSVTIASPVSSSLDVILFTTLGDTAELVWTGTAWRILALYNMVTGGITTPTVS